MSVSSFSSPSLSRPARTFLSPLASSRVQEIMSDLVAEQITTAPEPTRKDGTVNMVFTGKKTVSTEPIPMPDNMQALDDFFLKEEHRNLLFFRNEARNVPNPTAEQMRKWLEEASKVGDGDFGGILTRDQNQVIQMKAPLSFPGLSLLTESTIGARLLLPGQANTNVEYPEFQFTLLDSHLTAKGPAPLVWLFNKLTKYRDSTSSFTRVRAMNAGGVNCDKIVFTTEARLETRIHIPSVVLKLLPVDVYKFEQQGSAAVQKLLEKELEPALLGFQDAYLKWISTKGKLPQLD